MSNPINDGGPAFPSNKPYENRPGFNSPILAARHYSGMSLRDWFAGKATSEDIDEHLSIPMRGHPGGESQLFTREQAKYRYADAMLAAKARTAQSNDQIADAIEIHIIDQMRQELARCVHLLDTDCCMPDGSNADTLKAHMILASFDTKGAS